MPRTGRSGNGWPSWRPATIFYQTSNIDDIGLPLPAGGATPALPQGRPDAEDDPGPMTASRVEEYAGDYFGGPPQSPMRSDIFASSEAILDGHDANR